MEEIKEKTIEEVVQDKLNDAGGYYQKLSVQ